jgi:hypothetical protein
MRTELLNQLEYEREFFNDKDYSGFTVGVITEVHTEDLDSKPLLADSKERIIDTFGNNQELLKIYHEVTDAGCGFVYLIGVYYQSKKEKLHGLDSAYKIFDQLGVDVIAVKNIELDEYVYDYPEIPEEIEVDFTGKVIKNNEVLNKEVFTTTLKTDNSMQVVGNRLFKDYFDIHSQIFKRKLEVNNKSSFRYFYSKDKSKHIEFENNAITVSNKLTPENKTMEFFAEAEYVTDQIQSSKLAKFGSEIKNFSVNLEGDIDYNTTSKRVEVYYRTANEFVKVPTDKVINNEKVSVLGNPDKIEFKLVLKNFSIKDDPPTVTNFKVDFDLVADDENIYYTIKNPNKYIRFRVDNKGNSFIRAKVDRDQFINDNQTKEYFIDDLANNCQENNYIGLLDAPSQDNDESVDEYYSRLIQTMQKIKELLSDKAQRYIGCMLNEVEYTNPSNSYFDSGLTGLAGLFGANTSDTSPTNESADNIVDSRTVFSNTEVENLTDYGYTAFVQTVRNGIAPYKVVSLGNKDEIYYSLNTTRIINETCKKLKDITEDYVGIATNSALEKLEKEIQSTLNELETEGKIQESSFEFSEISESSIQIDVSFTPISEIFSIQESINSTL